MITPGRSRAKSRVDQAGPDRIKSAISPHGAMAHGSTPGTVAPEISRTSSFRSASSARGISIGPSTPGPNVMSRSLSRSESRPGTQSSRSQSDSMRGSRGGRPNLRVKRSRRGEPHLQDKGRMIRSGRGSVASRSIDSQPLRRRIKCSGTRDHPRKASLRPATSMLLSGTRCTGIVDAASPRARESKPLCYGLHTEKSL